MAIGIKVVTSSVKLSRVQLTHTTAPWFVPYHINFNDPNGTQQDAFSPN